MLESLLFTQGKVVLPPPKPDIIFRTSSTSATTITTSGLGTGFTTEYSVDGGPLAPAGTTFSIPVGEHEVMLKFNVTTGTLLTMQSFKDILTEVTDWEGFQLPNIQFQNCTKLIKVPEYLPVTVTNMSYMFYGCTSFNHDIGQWDVSNVTKMDFMFAACTSFNQDISSWDVSQVMNMIRMFAGCTSFNQDISSWDVGQVTDISYMFYNSTSFNQDLSSTVFKSSVVRSNYDRGATAWNATYRPQFTG